ncbi:Phosphoinositide phosphatase SAC6 [Vitis vinifera]|uniref:Phosphoinositide phosphatase SAC6 n=1 Tax=Vitis vinifera TaxID=29760 RepID=A0A438HMF3_VITVI|nr:Phosphoinositide phosphatase SAC6 [Vitis vinifera]
MIWVKKSCLGMKYYKMVLPYSVRDTLSGWSGFNMGKKRRKVWKTTPSCIFWVVWKERNRIAFDNEELLMNSAQRLHDLGDESKLLPLWRQADPRFLWNNYMLEVLIDNKLDPYLLPVIQGNILISYFQAAIGKDIIDVTLIARRCTRRTEGNDVREIDGGEEKKKSYGNAVSTLRLAGSMTDIVTLKHVLEETPMKRLYFLEGTRMWRRGADSDGAGRRWSKANEGASGHLVEAQSRGPSSGSPIHECSLFWEKDELRRLREAEAFHKEQTKTDLALVEEAKRYVQPDCLSHEPPLSPSFLFGRIPVREFCDLSGPGKKCDEDENPLQMIMGSESPLRKNGECWDLVEVSKSSTDDVGKDVSSDQIVPRVSKAGEEISWENSDLAKFSNFLGFSTEGLEKDIMEFLVKIRKRRERVHSKSILEKSKFERELKRLECSINYEGGKKQNVGGQVRGCQIMEFK